MASVLALDAYLQASPPDEAPPSAPMDDSQRLFREAFLEAPTKLTFTPTEEQAQETRLFILDGPEYLQLKNYVDKGAVAPETPRELASKFGNIFQRGAKYDELLNLMKDIHSHCSTFKEESLGTYITLARGIIKFCDTVARYLSGRGVLRVQLETVMRDDLPQDEIDAATNTARPILAEVCAEAEKLEATAETLQKNLFLFVGQTREDLRKLKLVDEYLDRIRKLLPSYSSTRLRTGPEWDKWNLGMVGLVLHNDLYTLEFRGNKALAAVETLKSTFGRISSNLREIQAKSNYISGAIGDEDAFARELAKEDLDMAIAKWHELKQLTNAFLDATRPQNGWWRPLS